MPGQISRVDPGNQFQTLRRLSDTIATVNDHTSQIADNTTGLQAVNTTVAGNLTYPAPNAPATSANINVSTVTGTAPAAANTQFAVNHNLGRVPVRSQTDWISIPGQLYQGPNTGTAWTATTVYLKCTVASASFQITLS